MSCFCGQVNMSMMMNPYINPFMGMSMGVGMFSSTPVMAGVPYCSMFSNNYNQPSVFPYMGMNSVFGGNMMANPFMFGFMSPIPSIMNLGQQIFNTGNRIGQVIHDNIGSVTGFFSESTPALPAVSMPSLGSLIRPQTRTQIQTPVQTQPQNAPVQTSSPNGTCRPATGKKLGKDFLEAVKAVAQRINCDYRDLIAVMNAESGLKPDAVNKKSGATGLIQFMPKTAERYGTTTVALKNMSAIEQLPYVEQYLKRCKKSAGFGDNDRLSGGELYALVFLPARAKREVLCERGEGNNYYEYNSGTDYNKDGKITKAELDQRINKFRVDETIFA